MLGGMSIFTMLMTIPQVLTIWVDHQAAGVSMLMWQIFSFCHRLVLVWITETREHLFAMHWMDRAE